MGGTVDLDAGPRDARVAHLRQQVLDGCGQLEGQDLGDAAAEVLGGGAPVDRGERIGDELEAQLLVVHGEPDRSVRLEAFHQGGRGKRLVLAADSHAATVVRGSATMDRVDPFSVLGVTPAASPEEVATAYRELAKAWHPDRRGTAGEERMAEINVAYELLRAGAQHERRSRPAPPPAPERGKGAGLSVHVRRALGPELLDALAVGERVRLVTPASTWTSPRTILALTDRRLLWLLDDAPVARVRSAPLRDVSEVVARPRRPRRRVATLQLRMTSGRRHAFAELRPHTAAAIERHVRAAAAQPRGRRPRAPGA